MQDVVNSKTQEESLKKELSDQQKLIILQTFNGATGDDIPSLKSLVEKCWPDITDRSLDGRSAEGKLVKEFLASRQLKAKAAHEYQKKTDQINLDEKQKEFIAGLADKMRPLEITRNLFNNQSLMPLSAEFKVVNEYYKSLDPKLRMVKENEVKKDYNPPKTDEQAIARINRYVMEGIDKEKINKKQKTWFRALIRFMHTHRFLLSMNDFTLEVERELFESSFVRFVYDKPDLTEEEIDLYINQCLDIINHRRIEKQITDLSDYIEDVRTGGTDKKISGAIIEQLGKLYSERDANMKRQKNTLDDLNGKRAKRLESYQRENASILTLIEMVQEKEKRDYLLELQEERKKKLGEEIGRLKGLEAIKAEIYGLTDEEAIG